MKEMKSTGLVSQLDPFFESVVDRGIQFYERKTTLLREHRTLNIIDEVEVRLNQQKMFEEAEAKRDVSYDEFLLKYIDHIEGRVTNEERNRPHTADDDNKLNIANPGEDNKPPEEEKKQDQDTKVVKVSEVAKD